MAKQIKKIDIELTEEEKKEEEKLVKKGYKSVVCPKCGTVYTGKFLTSLVSCGACNIRRGIDRRMVRKK